ncbi:hypothetical protein [Pseudomonas putida]|uniref:hypothetical protein n=1 Tax=Pseudomonas putida TaxID=303 RepID=UPI003906C84B
MWMAVGMGVAIGIFLAFQFLLFLFSFSPAVAWMLDKNIVAFLKDVVGPVSAGFGGAVAGAYAAFRFQNNAEKRKELRAAARTLTMAKLNLMQKINDLASIKKHSVFQYRDHPARFIMIGELPESRGVREPIDPSIIDLLMGVKAGELIGRVLLADKRYEACFENFKLRNKALFEYRAILTGSHLGQKYNATLADICSVIEPGRLIALHVNTEGVLEMFDETIESLSSALNAIGDALDKSFKGKGLAIMTVGTGDKESLEKLPSPRFNVESLTAFIQRSRKS